MSGGGGKGGSQTQTSQTEIPEWLEREARQNIDIARGVATQGFVPYYGPDVAALSPMQEAAMQGTGQAASAFGLPGGNPMAGMPAAQDFGNGVRGYSSGPMFDQALQSLQANRPGQYDAIMSMFVNPQTGAAPGYPYGDGGRPSAPQAPANPVGGSSRMFDNEGADTNDPWGRSGPIAQSAWTPGDSNRSGGGGIGGGGK